MESTKNTRVDAVVGAIYVTRDVEAFNVNKINSDVVSSMVKKLKQSIREHGLTQPIRVDENFNIRDGHHRFTAIKELYEEGIETDIYYFFNVNKNIDERTDMIVTNIDMHKKGNNEMIQVYDRSGDEASSEIMELCEMLGVSPSRLCKVAIGSQIGDINKRLQEGTLKVENREKVIKFFRWYNELPKNKLGLSADIDVVILYKDFYCQEWFNPQHFVKGIEAEYEENGRKKVFAKGDAHNKRELFVKLYNKNRKINLADYRYNNKKWYEIVVA